MRNQGFMWAMVANFVVVALIVFALVGCGGPMMFAKPGGTPAQLAADGYECDQQWERSAGAIAFRQDPLGNAYYAIKARSDKAECMTHRGWTRTDK